MLVPPHGAALANEGYNRSCVIGCYALVARGVALLVVSAILPESRLAVLEPLLSPRLFIGLVSATIGLLLKLVLLPFIILSLGVVYFLINGLMLKLASEFVPGFRVNGCLTAVFGSILLTIVDYLLNRLAGI